MRYSRPKPTKYVNRKTSWKKLTLKDIRGLPIVPEFDLYNEDHEYCGWSSESLEYVKEITSHYIQYDYKGDLITKIHDMR